MINNLAVSVLLTASCIFVGVFAKKCEDSTLRQKGQLVHIANGFRNVGMGGGYFRDHKTGLCFLRVHTGFFSDSVTQVPCESLYTTNAKE